MSATLLLALLSAPAALPTAANDPVPGGLVVDTERGEIRFPATVQYPRGKPCIDAWGQRIQAFLGCERSGGARSEFADFFVFLSGVDTAEVYKGLVEVGATTQAHYSRAEGRQRAGRDYLQGDPVAIVIAWKDGDRWVERPYEDFVREKTTVDGKEVVGPWRPHFVFHGSGVIHEEGTGCIACPCDCPGGIIADNRLPIYEPKPTVRFDLKDAPPEGSSVVVRIRPIGPGKPEDRGSRIPPSPSGRGPG